MSIAILVDNPQRDLDGCVILAKHLVSMGHKAILVPMYNQLFDIIAIKPIIVVVNYVRSNNIHILTCFRYFGIRVAVLDTEGAPARVDRFVSVLESLKINRYVDHYFFWGESQKQLADERGVTAELSTSVFGSPRYDFCCSPWNSALPDTGHTQYILVNTAFPYLNPKYTNSHRAESRATIKNGVPRETVDKVYSKGLVSFERYKKSIREIASAFSAITFVVRPHPFESAGGYTSLLDLPNIKIIQEGASLSWINKAICVLHINCTTSVESRLLGKVPISLDWLNFEETRVRLPSLVSVNAGSVEDVILSIKEILLHRDHTVVKNTLEEIKKEFGPMDGMSSRNTASVLDRLCAKALPPIAWYEVPLSLWAGLAIRGALGYSLFQWTKVLFFGRKIRYRRIEKSFKCADVNRLLLRLNKIDGKNVKAIQMCSSQRLSTNESLLLSLEN